MNSRDESFQPNRRRFLAIVGTGLAGLWSAVIAGFAGLFLFGPLRRVRASEELSIGSASSFGADFTGVRVTVAPAHGWYGQDQKKTVYVKLREDGTPFALSGECTHLGCTVGWNAEDNEFQCPCHGGRFDPQGRQTAGPPPEPLPEFAAEIRDGNVYIRVA